MAAYAADLSLWEAVRDGNISRAAEALNCGADPNRPLAVSKDLSTGQPRVWDFFGDGHLVWRHVLVTAYPGSGCKEQPTRGVPTSASARPCAGDRYLHLAVKLKWPTLLKLLASRVEIDENLRNDEGVTGYDEAYAFGGERVALYLEHFVGKPSAHVAAALNGHEQRRRPSWTVDNQLGSRQQQIQEQGVGIARSGKVRQTRKAKKRAADSNGEGVGDGGSLTPRSDDDYDEGDSDNDDDDRAEGCEGGRGRRSNSNNDNIVDKPPSSSKSVTSAVPLLSRPPLEAPAPLLGGGPVPTPDLLPFLGGATPHASFLATDSLFPSPSSSPSSSFYPTQPPPVDGQGDDGGDGQVDGDGQGNGHALSPLRVARAEFRKSAARSMAEQARGGLQTAANQVANRLAGHVEQPLEQPDPQPCGNDETVVPHFPRGQRVPVELPTRSWRAPTLNETTHSFGLPHLASATEILLKSDRDTKGLLSDSLVGKRFLLLRPTVSLVTVRSVHEQWRSGGSGSGGAKFSGLCAPPLQVPSSSSCSGVGAAEAHLMVTYVEDGAAFHEVSKPASWFKANSRPAR